MNGQQRSRVSAGDDAVPWTVRRVAKGTWRRLAATRVVRTAMGRRSPSSLLAHLLRQIDAARDGASAAHQAIQRGQTGADARAALDRIEHRGDVHRSELVVALARVLVAPIDREDIYRFSRSIDDVLDNLRDFVREWDLYGGPTAPGLAEVLVHIGEVLDRLRDAIELLGDAPGEVAGAALEARKAGNQIRYRYQDEIAVLFVDPVTAEILRLRELYRRLDVVGLRLGEAADVIADAAVKRSLL